MAPSRRSKRPDVTLSAEMMSDRCPNVRSHLDEQMSSATRLTPRYAYCGATIDPITSRAIVFGAVPATIPVPAAPAAKDTTTGTSEKTGKRTDANKIPAAALRTTIIMVQCSILERTNSFCLFGCPRPFIDQPIMNA
jgi:hypothetical protein